jgi:hypothetical protein
MTPSLPKQVNDTTGGAGLNAPKIDYIFNNKILILIFNIIRKTKLIAHYQSCKTTINCRDNMNSISKRHL